MAAAMNGGDNAAPLEPPFLPDDQTLDDWERVRRPELLELFASRVYGTAPTSTDYTVTSACETLTTTTDGTTVRRLTVTIVTPRGSTSWPVQVLVPQHQPPTKLPLVLLLANTCRPGPRVNASSTRVDDFWPTDLIADGCATAVLYNGDAAPDHPDDFYAEGIHPLFDDTCTWGAVAVWSWACLRVLDAIDQQFSHAIDTEQTLLVGHSRGGKAALWAAVQDTRIEMVVANNSGCTGAGVAQCPAAGAETIAQLNAAFPHWFCEAYRQHQIYENGHDDNSPQSASLTKRSILLDQHLLLGLVAPRRLYVTSASRDAWANPPAEYRATREACLAVWIDLYGDQATRDAWAKASKWPIPVNTPVARRGRVGSHLREGDHDLCRYDWIQILDFFRQEEQG